MATDVPTAPTLDEIRSWPATIDIPRASRALGISQSHGYGLAQREAFPVRVIRVGGSYRVVTAALVQLLEGSAA